MGEPVEQAQAPMIEASIEIIEIIDETTVGMLGVVRVPMGNMTFGTYTLPDGSTARDWICSLALEGGGVFVGKGSMVEVGGVSWRVVEVRKTPGELGSVTLQRMQGSL